MSELPRYYAHEGPLEAFTIKDRVRGMFQSRNKKLKSYLRETVEHFTVLDVVFCVVVSNVWWCLCGGIGVVFTVLVL